MISIVIPVLDELKYLELLIPELKKRAQNYNLIEILVVDASRSKNIEKFCQKNEILYIPSNQKQRAYQMNRGAESAKGDMLYFLHCDSIPPPNFDREIIDCLADSKGGCFRMKFDLKNPILSFYSYFTRFSGTIFHGGDASLFIMKDEFYGIGKFDEAMTIMEDYNIIKRMKQKASFKVIPKYVVTSARKYEINGIINLQWKFAVIHLMNALGYSQEKMINYYRKNIRQ